MTWFGPRMEPITSPTPGECANYYATDASQSTFSREATNISEVYRYNCKLVRLSLQDTTAIVVQHVAHPFVLRKVFSLILDPNCVLAKDFKSCAYCCYVRCVRYINSMSRGRCYGQNRLNSLPFTVRTLIQRSYNHRVGCNATIVIQSLWTC